MPKDSRSKRQLLREIIRTDPAIALIAGSILGPPPGLDLPKPPDKAADGTQEVPNPT